MDRLPAHLLAKAGIGCGFAGLCALEAYPSQGAGLGLEAMARMGLVNGMVHGSEPLGKAEEKLRPIGPI